MQAYVNGYGSPKDPLRDENICRYLGAVLQVLAQYPHTAITLFLAGGYTNRPDMSEAAAMLLWLKEHGLPSNTSVELIETTDTARDNMLEFKRQVGDMPVLIFCERSRTPTMKFFAQQLFAQATVHGVAFDTNSMRLTHRIRQRTLKLWLEQLSWHSSRVDSLRKWLRKRHVACARTSMR